mgnify:CR=1 FL=1|jgi:ribonuclease P protein component
MLSSNNRLNKTKDFDLVFKKGRSIFSKNIGVKVLKNSFKINRFGVIVGVKVSKLAVERNLIKKRLRTILRQENKKLLEGYDIVLIVLPELKNLKYQEIEKMLNNIFKKHRLYQKNKQ